MEFFRNLNNLIFLTEGEKHKNLFRVIGSFEAEDFLAVLQVLLIDAIHKYRIRLSDGEQLSIVFEERVLVSHRLLYIDESFVFIDLDPRVSCGESCLLGRIPLLASFCPSRLRKYGMGLFGKPSFLDSSFSSRNLSTSERTCFFWNLVSLEMAF